YLAELLKLKKNISLYKKTVAKYKIMSNSRLKMVTTKNKRNDFIFNLAIYDKKNRKIIFKKTPVAVIECVYLPYVVIVRAIELA
ncbi:hypothetical protein AF306_15845, partial [Listeria monocytogenes]|nr:hypothetical protein [Listeria monocytogenes]